MLRFTQPEGTKCFIVYCDVSRVSLECVLIQHGKVVAYASTKLNLHEKNYPIDDLEFLVVVFALKIRMHYLYVVHVDVYTNHRTLQYVFRLKKLNV